MFKLVLQYLCYCLVGLFITSCTPSQDQSPLPTHIKIGLLPDRESIHLIDIHRPLFDHIASKLGVTYELIIPDGYSKLVELFGAKKIDLAFLGGISFISAHKQYGAVPLVMRNIDKHFVSYLIVRKERNSTTLDSLEDQHLAFGSKLSTSGHIMPRYFFSKMNLIPENFFSDISYSGAHHKTLEYVIEKKADAGVINGAFYQMQTQRYPHYQEELSILWRSPPYPNYVWAVQASSAEEFKQKLREVFLSLTLSSSVDRRILNSLNIEAFYPAKVSDFTEIEKALKVLESFGDKH